MAVTITELRTMINENDATTGWSVSGLSGSGLYTSNPSPIEPSGCMGYQVNNENGYCYRTVSLNLSGTLLYTWIRPFGTMNTFSNTGVGFVLGDGTNTIGYSVGGSDVSGFKHMEGPHEWVCFVLDTASLPASYVTIAGSEASLNLGSITLYGCYFYTLAKALGGADNCFVDYMRYGTQGIRITGGGVGTEGDFDDIATAERNTATEDGAYGIIREVAIGSGAFGCQGPITWGDTSTASVDFESNGETLIFEEPYNGVATSRFWLKLEGNSTGTQDVVFNNVTFLCPAGVGAAFTATNANLNTVTLDTCLVKGFEQGIDVLSATTSGTYSITDSTFDGCGQIDLGFLLQDGTFSGCTISNSTDSATGALLLSSTGYVSGLDLDDTTFVSGGTGHGIYITQTGTYDFTNVIFTGYGATGTTDAAVYNNSGGSVTINASGCSGLTYRNGASASTTIVADPISITVTVKDIDTQANIENARVLLVASDATGDLPYEESVTQITRSASTATVSHTGHGMATDDFVLISGANQSEYNGCFQITYIGADSYSYTVPGTPTTPATGTIIATGGFFNTLTNASGEVSDSRTIASNQPVTGRVRLSSGATLYKSSPLSGTVSSSSGWSQTSYLISDD